jgi:hypothetical protein
MLIGVQQSKFDMEFDAVSKCFSIVPVRQNPRVDANDASFDMADPQNNPKRNCDRLDNIMQSCRWRDDNGSIAG